MKDCLCILEMRQHSHSLWGIWPSGMQKWWYDQGKTMKQCIRWNPEHWGSMLMKCIATLTLPGLKNMLCLHNLKDAVLDHCKALVERPSTSISLCGKGWNWLCTVPWTLYKCCLTDQGMNIYSIKLPHPLHHMSQSHDVASVGQRERVGWPVPAKQHPQDVAYLREWAGTPFRNRPATIVATKVADIQELTEAKALRYMDSENSPADDITQGKTLRKMAGKNMWSHSPAFLGLLLQCWTIKPEAEPLNSLKRMVSVFQTFGSVELFHLSSLTAGVSRDTGQNKPGFSKSFERWMDWRN